MKESDILIKIWSKPREIFRYINDNSIDKFTITLLFLAGITRSFDRAVSNNYGDNLSLLVLVLLAVTLGGLLGWLSIYIYAALLNWTGGWLKSKGNTDAIVRMLAHALIPSIVSLLFLVPQIIIFGNGVFQSSFNLLEYGTGGMIFYFITAILQIALGIWTTILVVIGLSEVQKISIGYAILNMILPGLIFLVPIFLIVFLTRGF